MNNITKKSFYSFLTLYLFSSFIFLFMASYWFYSSQNSMEIQNNYYKMNNIADKVSSSIINAHMMGDEFILEKFPNTKISLYGTSNNPWCDTSMKNIDLKKDYYINGDTFTLVSRAPNGHLGIDHVVVQSDEFSKISYQLRNKVIITSIFIGIVIVIIAVLLSSMFLRPIKEKIQEIEEFVKDTTHELNTPITALMMSTSRAKSKKEYDEKIIQNISISTKQLYDIYSSLSFLSFDTKHEDNIELDFANIVKESVEYFDELLSKKKLHVEFVSSTCKIKITPTKAKMIINNLLSNAIKYSLPNKKIYIEVQSNSFSIKDEGIGIAKDKLHTVFQRFSRANSYAGGFGVGLNIVDSITKEYKYTLNIESQKNVGTTINIKFN
ncbi:HAMP domain-containing histidine kinase [Sulfurimonas sp.]|nr:HAMP domain-containing histidine kinase [Sulfurimonas sp.]